MRWIKLNKGRAEQIFKNWTINDAPREFNAEPHYQQLLEDLKLIDDEVQKEMAENNILNKASYFYDLQFGIRLYELTKNKYNMTVRDASDDGVWIYISMQVIPDIIEERWGLSDTRFYRMSRRIWLKTMWWYIHLSWNETREKTLEILSPLSTDEIVQLVERRGPYGYRVDFARELMKQFHEKGYTRNSKARFRQIMRLNTAKVKMVEPELYPGGTEQYVSELIGYFDQ